MFTFEEINSWEAPEIVRQIESRLEPGWRFVCEPDMGMWAARIEQPDDDGEAKVLWEDESPDQRLVLFNAFGWVWARHQPQRAADSPWRRRRDLTRKSVTQGVSASSTSYPEVPDPEDLDPSEVLAVYEKGLGKR